MTLLVSLVCALAIYVLILRALRQRTLLKPLMAEGFAAEETAPRISIVVPARNEAENIGACLEGLLAQRYPPHRLNLLAIDDESSDATPHIVAALARKHPNLVPLRSPVLGPGWTGKCQACWNAAQAAPGDADWLCFIDADMRGEPLLIASAIRAAMREQVDLLTLAPRHTLASFAERLIIPCGLFFMAFYQDLNEVQAPDSAKVTANGQFMLVRREAYASVGGHAAVHGAICEDATLAALLKREGHSVLMMDGTQLISTRMYTGWSDLWEGVSKNLSEMLGGPARTLLCAAAAFVFAWALLLIPVADLTVWQGNSGAIVALVLALLSLSAALGLHIAGAIHFRIPVRYAFLFPLAYSIGAAIALDSVRRRAVRRIAWKGRVYP